MSLSEQIKSFQKWKKSLLFTTPSHSQGAFIDDESKKQLGKGVFECDYSEIEGFDNLRQPEGILKELLDNLTNIYGSKQTFILTNGSSSGILASMVALLRDNDKVIIPRNCHISVTNGLILTGAIPVWIMPEYDSEWGVFKGITADSVKTAIEQNPDAKALIITSPTYEGLFSEIAEISKITKKANIPLIVDEAHGALLPFGDFKSKPAIHCGADISVQSLHKTAGALTPAAVLHLGKNSTIEPETVQNALNLINTTSPPYTLLLSVENTVKFLASPDGKRSISELQAEIKTLSQELPQDFEIYSNSNDPTKILFKVNNADADKIAQYLNNECNIEEEFTNGKSLLFITGIGTRKEKLRKLFDVLKDINIETSAPKIDFYDSYKIPEYVMRPKDAFFAPKKKCNPMDAIGQIAAEPILNYPPGIPIVVPGEKIQMKMADFEKSLKVLV